MASNRELTWIDTEHVAVSTTPLRMPSEIKWQYQDGEWTAEVGAPKLQNSQSDVPKSEETDEIGASKCDIRDFDDEHAEGRFTDFGRTSDSRENLEADVREWWRIAIPGVQETEVNCINYNKTLGWLDRQAAITERECRQREYAEGDVYRKVYTESRIDEMIRDSKRELELQRERNTELQAALDQQRAATANANDLWGRTRDELAAVKAEREAYRSLFGKSLDLADEIRALGADCDTGVAR